MIMQCLTQNCLHKTSMLIHNFDIWYTRFLTVMEFVMHKSETMAKSRNQSMLLKQKILWKLKHVFLVYKKEQRRAHTCRTLTSK